MRRGLLCALALLAAVPPAGAAAGGWPTEGGDERRTGQSDVVGPRSAARTASVVLPFEQAVNMPATIAADGTVYVGTWGLIRSYGEADRRLWHKLDGELFAFTPDLEPAWLAPFPGDRVPYCYDYPGRAPTPGQCPTGGTVSFYNGTVEGTPALSADGATLYVGRGDGKLYAVDAATGAELWSFATFDPVDPDDPDGGGEVVASPLVAPDGTIYFATLAAGPHETNAIYAVAPDGALRWRYPSAEASYPNIFVAAPALSPDGDTLYVAGAWGPATDDRDVTIRGTVLAFDLEAADGGGEERLKWIHEPINEGEPWRPTVWTTALAVGSDGTLYASGPEHTLGGGSAVAYALTDRGDHAEPAWPAMVDLDRNRAAFTVGLALREVDGVTTRVYAGSGNVFTPLAGYRAGGKLYALDPQTGAPLWPEPFDPEEHGGFGTLTGIAVDAEGVIYTGASGKLDGGRVFAIAEDRRLLWSHAVTGLLEWAHPVLGPRGDLYFADTRRHLCTIFARESGACDDAGVDPALYAVFAGGATEPCVADEETLCLGGGRFELTVDWTTPQGTSGPGRVAPPVTADSGIFWFFDPDNWEMLVKVLDGCEVNDRFWVFYAATTNVGFTLHVRDTDAGVTREYPSAQGPPADAVTDTLAFDTCP